jgi:hypothetical protein
MTVVEMASPPIDQDLQDRADFVQRIGQGAPLLSGAGATWCDMVRHY